MSGEGESDQVVEPPTPTELVGYLMATHSEWVSGVLKKDAECFEELAKGSQAEFLIVSTVVSIASIAAVDTSIVKQAIKYGLEMAKEARNG